MQIINDNKQSTIGRIPKNIIGPNKGSEYYVYTVSIIGEVILPFLNSAISELYVLNSSLTLLLPKLFHKALFYID